MRQMAGIPLDVSLSIFLFQYLVIEHSPQPGFTGG